MTVPFGAPRATPPAPEWFEYVILDGRDEGLCDATPNGPEGTKTEFCRWIAPSATRVVRWVIAARGDWPEAPDPAGFTRNYKLLRSEIGLQSALPAPGDDFAYGMFGTYSYVCETPPPLGSDIPVGGYPPMMGPLGPKFRTFPRRKFKRFLDTGTIG